MTINNEHKKLNFSNEREQSQACLNSAEHEKNQGRKVLNVPNLRFPEFQGEWEKCTLNEVCKFHNGRAYKQTELLAAGKYRVLRVGNFFTNDSWYYSNLELEDNKYAQNGDLLYAWSASFGPRFWREEKVIFHYHIWKIDSFKNVDKNFLYHFLDLDSAKIKNEVQGGTMVHITKGDMEKRTISYPSVPEQRNIARFLFLLDERIATQNKIIEDLKMLKSAIIENVFNVKHSEILQLNDVGSYIRGLTYSSNDVVEHGGTLVMRSNNIVNGSLLDYNNNVVFVNKQMSAEQQLQNGDIVICMANGSSSLVGKSSFYDGNCHSSITVGAFCGIYRSKEPIVKWLFQTNKYRRYIWNSLQGGNGAIANLNGEDILNMSFSIPNAPIKETCVKMLTSVDSALENNVSLCALYTLQKQYLLRQMFI